MELIRGTSLRGYCALVSELGSDPHELLRSVGIRPADTESVDAFVPLRNAVRAAEMAAAATATPDFGRRLALRQDVGILGPLAVAVRTAANVADVFTVFGTYVGAYSRGISIVILPQPDPTVRFLQWRLMIEPLPPHPQAAELSLGVMLGVLRTFLGEDYSPSAVHIPHRMLTPASEYRAYFGCPVRDGAPAAGLRVASADLARSLDQDHLLHRIAIGYLNSASTDRADLSAAESVADVVRRLLPSGAATIDMVARGFGLHPKALQRRLSAEGTNFAAVVDDVRKETAEHYLRDTDISLGHLSRELGYAEQSVLTRACRRWFGRSPLAHRAALRDPAVSTPGDSRATSYPDSGSGSGPDAGAQAPATPSRR